MEYFKKIDKSDKIICLLCNHYCRLEEDQSGICGVNKNINDELVNLVYAQPSCLNIDPVEKKPLYHFLPGSLTLSLGTIGCNFKCPFCQNWTLSQNKNIAKDVDIAPSKIVKAALDSGCSSVAYTYNEPTIFYPYAKDIGLLAKRYGVKNIFVTNGYESKEVIRDISSWLDAANIDLKSWSDSYYKKVLKGTLKEVKECIVGMKEGGIWVEITTLLIEGVNDDTQDLKEMARFIVDEVGKDTPWHISAFHPDYKMRDKRPTSLDTLKRAYDIAKDEGLEYVYLGNVTLEADTYCPKCYEPLIIREGYRVLENKIAEGKCPKCGTNIAGVWR
ncbi:MAG: AmmeMemoRadiSam system radical SAM enzyme [Epsilonproteobacteria bacterium]|nr:AmmeMemoRadiSam system radical SAM enzyme [Campylobacterota bacterium]